MGGRLFRKFRFFFLSLFLSTTCCCLGMNIKCTILALLHHHTSSAPTIDKRQTHGFWLNFDDPLNFFPRCPLEHHKEITSTIFSRIIYLKRCFFQRRDAISWRLVLNESRKSIVKQQQQKKLTHYHDIFFGKFLSANIFLSKRIIIIIWAAASWVVACLPPTTCVCCYFLQKNLYRWFPDFFK